MSENTDYETLKAERDSALNACSLIADALGIKGAVAGGTIARVQQLVSENAALTDKSASELSNSWLLHRAVMTIQAALHCIHGTNIYEAQCWLESIADDAELVIPPEMMLSDLQRWFDENMTGLITHAKAVEIIKAEMSATTQALNEIKAQAIENALDAQFGRQAVTDELTGKVYLCAAGLRQFTASLRGEQNA